MRYLIEFDGERHVVESLDGYDGCSVIEEGVAEPRGHCDRVEGPDGKKFWRPNREKAEEAQMARTPKVDLVRRIVALEAALAKIAPHEDPPKGQK